MVAGVTFPLTTEKWISVRGVDGAMGAVSLRDALLLAPRLAAISGDTPTQDAAMLRLLLAVVRRCYPDVRSTRDWQRLWESGRLDEERIDAYLDRFADRFDLLHPTTPFYQVADLRTAKGEFTDLSRLIPDVPAGHQYFTTRAGRTLRTMTFAEAARWIVHCHAFDPSGIKSGAVGDPRVKGGKGYPIGIAWCGWLGLIIPEGGSLFETLLLNFQVSPKHSSDQDLPAWERPALGPAEEAGHAHPRGPADLLSWQSRRIRLGHDGTQATGVLIANGDPLHPLDLFSVEMNTNWRKSEAQRKARRSPVDVYMPRAHQPDRAAWRGMEALLARARPGADVREGGWLEWLSRLMDDDALPLEYPLRLRVVGMEYGSQSAVISDIVDDRLAMRLAVLTQPELTSQAITAVADADNGVRELARLAAELVRAAGGHEDLANVAASTARSEAFAQLDAPYRRWLAQLAPGTDGESASALWQGHVRELLSAAARELLASAPPTAWVGREQGDVPLNAATASRWFYRNLGRHLPRAYPALVGATERRDR